jgi:hypothetical protein
MKVVGARIVVESERATRPPRRGLIEALLQNPPPAYRVLWDDGRTSIVRPAAGCARIGEAPAVDEGELLSRAINDRIRELERHPVGTHTFVCECVDVSCTHVMHLTGGEYDEIRAGNGLFAVLPGHEHAARSRVVARGERFVVVERRRR